jgi:hypothetical protein
MTPDLQEVMESPKGQVGEKASVRVKGMERAEKRSVMASWVMNTFLNAKCSITF